MTMFKKNEKGFTLIELLIVVAIIGLLATLAIVSLTSAQKRARDTKRVSDIGQIKGALELYWNANAAYPTITPAAGALDTWAELATALTGYISALPTDPDDSKGTAYTYMHNSTNQIYYVAADLEDTTHQSLTQDTDGSLGGTGYRSLTSKGTLDTSDATLSCDDANGIYCLYGDATK